MKASWDRYVALRLVSVIATLILLVLVANDSSSKLREALLGVVIVTAVPLVLHEVTNKGRRSREPDQS